MRTPDRKEEDRSGLRAVRTDDAVDGGRNRFCEALLAAGSTGLGRQDLAELFLGAIQIAVVLEHDV